MDVLDPREVMGHGNKVPGGPSSEELARLFEQIFRRYPKASAIGFATIPSVDQGGLSNRRRQPDDRGCGAWRAGAGARVGALRASAELASGQARFLRALHKLRTRRSN